MKELIPRIDEMWKIERHKLEDGSEKITDHLVSYQLTLKLIRIKLTKLLS